MLSPPQPYPQVGRESDHGFDEVGFLRRLWGRWVVEEGSLLGEVGDGVAQGAGERTSAARCVSRKCSWIASAFIVYWEYDRT